MNIKILFHAVVPVTLALASQALAQPFNINTANRDEVRQFYNLVYPASSGVPMGWTGSITGCNPGTDSQAYLDATLLRVNFFRALAGVPSGITFSNLFNTKAQAAALMMSANNQLNHLPPTNWSCYSADGYDGASHGNLAGYTGPEAVDAYMIDGSVLGHRRWVIYAPTLMMGSGNVSSSTINGTNHDAESALYVFGGPTASPRPATRDPFVAWPPKGFIAYPVVPHLWSFSFPDADFSSANVTLQRGGTNVAVLVTSRTDNGYGDNTLIWVPDNLDPNSIAAWPKPGADDVWTVTVNNVITNSVAQNFTYNVTIFDPAVAGPDYHPAVVSGPDQPVLNQANAYTFSAVPTATAYQWRSTKLLPFNVTDGAENGLVNFTAVNNPGYGPITNTFAASGSNCFLLSGRFGDKMQTLTLNFTLEATDTSQITFQSRRVWTGASACRLEVSTDGGAYWNSAWAQIGGSDNDPGAFSPTNVNLAAYAGMKIQVRFNLVHDPFLGVYTFWPSGWYIDDITFSNFFDVSTAATISNVPGGLTFDFNPTEQANFELDVRPQFYGGYWSSWGPVKRVTTASTASAPTATTLAASSVTANAATLNGTVNPNGADTTTYFQYGLTTNYGSFSATNNFAATNTTLAVANLLSGLTPGATYHYRLVASNSAGSATGADQIFGGFPHAFTGAEQGQGLDLQGSFVYAVAAGEINAPGLVGDANFTTDNVPGVTITTPGGTLNTVNGWANPNFGATTSGLRLAQAMSSIRWTVAPGILTVNLAGLQLESSYQLQLLFIESCCDRVFDVKLNGTTIVPAFRLLDYGPLGTAIVIPCNFTATGSNALIQLGGGTGGTDNNPALSAFTLEALAPAGPTPIPFSLTGSSSLAGGAFQLSFTNLGGLGFTVLGTTNPGLPLSNWTVLGPAVETPSGSGQYQFTDPQATNNATQFYRVRSP